MQTTFKTFAAAAALAFASAATQATPIGTITHDYGTATGNVAASTGGTSCDTLNATTITVTNKSGCARFLDTFDFGAMAYSAIDSFTLSLTFAGTNGFLENWGMRPASSAFNGSAIQPGLTKISDSTTQLFTISNTTNKDVFNAIVAGGSFYLWFASNGIGTQSFTLDSATLTVNGTAAAAVPEPGSLALLGVAALGLAGARRRARKNGA